MSNFNFTIVEGNLKADPEMNGSVCTFEVVCEENEKVTVFEAFTEGRLAETTYKYLKKGSRVLVSGKLSIDEDKKMIRLKGKEVNFLSPSK